MAAVARTTDSTFGICYTHNPPLSIGGSITGGSGSSYADGLAVARVGDTVTAGCGHTGNIDSGAGTTYDEGKAVARNGDPFSGTYVGNITSGSGTTFAV